MAEKTEHTMANKREQRSMVEARGGTATADNRWREQTRATVRENKSNGENNQSESEAADSSTARARAR